MRDAVDDFLAGKVPSAIVEMISKEIDEFKSIIDNDDMKRMNGLLNDKVADEYYPHASSIHTALNAWYYNPERRLTAEDHNALRHVRVVEIETQKTRKTTQKYSGIKSHGIFKPERANEKLEEAIVGMEANAEEIRVQTLTLMAEMVMVEARMRMVDAVSRVGAYNHEHAKQLMKGALDEVMEELGIHQENGLPAMKRTA